MFLSEFNLDKGVKIRCNRILGGKRYDHDPPGSKLKHTYDKLGNPGIRILPDQRHIVKVEPFVTVAMCYCVKHNQPV